MSACVLDSDVVIAGLDRRDAHHADAVAAIKALAGSDVTLLISAVNYAEVLVRPAADADTLRTAVDAIAALGIRTAPATQALAVDAARFRARGVSLPDGFALATAASRSAVLATFDARVRKVMGEAGVSAPPVLG